MTHETHRDFLRQKFGGPNWVLARRTARIVGRYGDDVICVSQQKYQAAEREYRQLYGDPHDSVRAKMYLALVELVDKHARPCFQGDPYTYEPEWANAIAAIKAEQERP